MWFFKIHLLHSREQLLNSLCICSLGLWGLFKKFMNLKTSSSLCKFVEGNLAKRRAGNETYGILSLVSGLLVSWATPLRICFSFCIPFWKCYKSITISQAKRSWTPAVFRWPGEAGVSTGLGVWRAGWFSAQGVCVGLCRVWVLCPGQMRRLIFLPQVPSQQNFSLEVAVSMAGHPFQLRALLWL